MYASLSLIAVYILEGETEKVDVYVSSCLVVMYKLHH